MSYVGLDGLKRLPEYQRLIIRNTDAERLLREHYGVNRIYKDGTELKHSCILPFGNHRRGDRNPSASICTDGNMMNCFVCGGGSLLWFVQQMEDCEPEEALDILKMYQREMDDDSFEEAIRASFEEEYQVPPVPQTFNEQMVAYWASFKHPYWASPSRRYTVETIEFWKLGYDPETNRVVIPHYFNGALVGWQTRTLEDTEWADGAFGPKWHNSDNFPRKDTLFNYDRARQYSSVVVVEAAASAIWLSQCGIPNVVASFGGGVYEKQQELLRHFDDVIFWQDADEAGWKGVIEANEGLGGHTNIWVVDSWQNDPNELSYEECWRRLYGQGLIPGYLFDCVLKSRVSKERYDGVHKVRRSRKSKTQGGSSARG